MLLVTDPVVKLMQGFAYREMILRERGNELFRQELLAYATGTNLDHAASAKGLVRRVGETDEALRYRIQQRNCAASNAGGADHYRFWAMAADARVIDAAVYSPDLPGGFGTGGQVCIAILSSEENLVPSPAVLDAVKTLVGRADVRMLNDQVQVIAASPLFIDATFAIKLVPGAPYSVYLGMTQTLASAFAPVQALGRDVTRSWLMGSLHVAGVHSVEGGPLADIIVAPDCYPILRSISFTFAGYSDTEGFGVVETLEQKARREAMEVYRTYAIANHRTHPQITLDLSATDRAGVITPTTVTFAKYLNLVGITDAAGDYLPSDEICYLIWVEISKSYI